MADPATDRGSRDRGAGPGTPLWVKVFGIIVVALIVLFVVVQIVTGGDHGPRRHSPVRHGPPPGVEHDGQDR